MSALKKWMARATTGQQKRLASLAKTSHNHLYQLASGARKAGPDLAARIERASRALFFAGSELPIIPRTSLCPACSRCEFARKRCG